MTITRKLTAATAALALAGSGVAAAADAPVVSAQKTSTATTAPATIPGTGVKQGQRLPAGARIVYRDVTLEGKQTVNLTIKRARRQDGSAGSSRATRATSASSSPTRATTPAASRSRCARTSNPKAAGEVTGRIYGLVR